jgi:hypothetical protein
MVNLQTLLIIVIIIVKGDVRCFFDEARGGELY